MNIVSLGIPVHSDLSVSPIIFWLYSKIQMSWDSFQSAIPWYRLEKCKLLKKRNTASKKCLLVSNCPIHLYLIFEKSSWKNQVKRQIKPKAGSACRRFSQKMNKQVCFVCCEKQKSKQNKFICSFFGRIYGTPICLRFNLTFTF